MARDLILTADERYWPKSKPVLFLGEWCKLYRRREVWQSMDFETLQHPWMDFARFEQDYRYLRGLYGRALKALAKSLNVLHRTDYSDRYWQILVGPWLATFLHIAFERWTVLSSALTDGRVGSIACPEYLPMEHTPFHMNDFYDRVSGDDWNGNLYASILKYLGIYECSNRKRHDQPPVVSQPPVKQRQFGRALVEQISGLFAKRSDLFMIATYIPLEKLIRMQLCLGQFPALWRTKVTPLAAIDPTRRQWQVELDVSNSFEGFVVSILHQQLPTIFCEGYGSLSSPTMRGPWPAVPRTIFTSNALWGDEIVMAYVAKQVSRGSILLYGQHGGLYGAGAFSWAEEHESAIADRFLTWGWMGKPREKFAPVGYFKRRLAQRWKCRVDGNLTLVCYDCPRYTHRLDSEAMVMLAGYTENCIRFAADLDDELRTRLLVRLSPRETGWEQEARWRDKFGDVRVERGQISMNKLMMESRLLVYTYNSTGFLEALVAGIPFVAFWDCDVSRLRPEAGTSFAELYAVGILHRSPESAANQVSMVWSNVDAWWQTHQVQSAIRQFSEKFCDSPKQAHAKMMNLLRENRNISRH